MDFQPGIPGASKSSQCHSSMCLMVLTRSQVFRSKLLTRAPGTANPHVHRPCQYRAALPIHNVPAPSGPSARERHRRRRKDEGSHENRVPLSAASAMVANGKSADPTSADDQDQGEQSAGQMLYAVSDIVLELLVYSDWPTLMAIEVRVRIRRLVEFFISKDDIEQFFNEMDVHDVLIAGSTVQNLFYMNLTWWHSVLNVGEAASHPLARPKDLNLIVPAGKREGMTHILGKMGYGSWTVEYSSLHYEGVLKAITRGYRMGSFLQPTSITLSESSTSSPLPVLLASPLTCQLNAISARRVYCLFPSLATLAVAIRTDYTHSGVCRHSYAHIETQTDNRRMTSSCGSATPKRAVGGSDLFTIRGKLYKTVARGRQNPLGPKIMNGDVVRVNQGYKELRIFGEDHRYTVVSSEGVPVPLRASRYLAKERFASDSIGSSGWEDTIAFDLDVYGGNILIARSDSNGAVVDMKRVDVQWANSVLSAS
ncbi:hypothetical protein BKA70DRAFT_1447520 [Coprinopsis sp. MPI-PUGE-AT-0042]|nr:hypothetical protein BKA70DRAFT_1447520 [Coprinopsis sp. MPI-PUGE-AT-0042]